MWKLLHFIRTKEKDCKSLKRLHPKWECFEISPKLLLRWFINSGCKAYSFKLPKEYVRYSLSPDFDNRIGTPSLCPMTEDHNYRIVKLCEASRDIAH